MTKLDNRMSGNGETLSLGSELGFLFGLEKVCQKRGAESGGMHGTDLKDRNQDSCSSVGRVGDY